MQIKLVTSPYNLGKSDLPEMWNVCIKSTDTHFTSAHVAANTSIKADNLTANISVTTGFITYHACLKDWIMVMQQVM